MCTVSMMMDYGLTRPRQYWEDPKFVQEFNELMKRSRQYDIDNNEPDCELDDKRKALKKLAEELNVDIKFI